MPDIQPENGTVRIANDTFDAIAAADLTRVELLCLMAVLRQSWGFGRKSTGSWCSLSFVQKYTGLKRSDCSRGLKGLVQKQLVAKEDGGFTQAAEYRPNKDYDRWSPGVLPAGFAPIGGARADTSDESGTSPGSDTSPPSVTTTSPRSGTTQETSNSQEKKNPPKPPRGRRVSASDKAGYIAHFRAEWERWTGKPSKMEDATIYGVAEKALKKHGLEKCKLVLSWAFQAPEAGWHRGEGKSDKVYLKGSTLWRPSNFPGYLAEAESWAAGETIGARFPSNDSLPQAVGGMQYVPFANDRNVLRDPSGLWLLSELNLLDESLPWYSVVAEVMQGFLNRKAAGERVDRYRPESYLRALSDCSHPAKPEQPQYLNNVLGRVVSRLEEGWQG